MSDRRVPVRLRQEGETTEILLLRDGEICYCGCNARGNVVIITADGRRYRLPGTVTLEALATHLGSRFFRATRSYLVRFDLVRSVIPWSRNRYSLRLEGVDEEIPLSKYRLREFWQHIGWRQRNARGAAEAHARGGGK